MNKEVELISTNETEDGITITFQTDKNVEETITRFTSIRFRSKKTKCGISRYKSFRN